MKLVQTKCPRCGCSLFAEPDDVMPYCEKCIEIVIRERTSGKCAVCGKTNCDGCP